MAIHFNIKINRFQKNGTFIKKSLAFKSSIARQEYKKFINKKKIINKKKFGKPIISKIRDVDITGHNAVDIKIPTDMAMKKYLKYYYNFLETKKISIKSKDWYNKNQKIQTVFGHIAKLYKRITSYKYGYNKLTKNKKLNSILAYYLIEDINRGYSVMRFVWISKNKKYISLTAWKKLLKHDLYNRFLGGVLESLSVRDNTKYFFKSFVMWGDYDITKHNNTITGQTWNKKIKQWSK